jgi:hypothetical protein
MFSAGNSGSLRSRAMVSICSPCRLAVRDSEHLAIGRRSGLLAVKDDGEGVKLRCTGVNHGYSSNRAAWRIARRRRARSWRMLGYGDHAGNDPPNIGRPLFDDSRVASS